MALNAMDGQSLELGELHDAVARLAVDSDAAVAAGDARRGSMLLFHAAGLVEKFLATWTLDEDVVVSLRNMVAEYRGAAQAMQV